MRISYAQQISLPNGHYCDTIKRDEQGVQNKVCIVILVMLGYLRRFLGCASESLRPCTGELVLTRYAI